MDQDKKIFIEMDLKKKHLPAGQSIFISRILSSQGTVFPGSYVSLRNILPLVFRLKTPNL